MKKYYLHIGLHKTGTTFLQKEVFPFLENFTFVTRPYTQNNQAFNKLQYANDIRYDEGELRSELDKISGDQILFSDESFSGKLLYFNYVNTTVIAKRLKRLLPDAVVILFIRGQKNIILSNYNQYVRVGGTKTLEDFVWQSKEDFSYNDYLKSSGSIGQGSLCYNTNDLYLNLENFKYYKLIKFYKELFPNTEVLLYEDLLYDPKKIIARLEKIFDTKLNQEAVNSILSGKKINKSISEKEIGIKISENKLRDFYFKKALKIFLKEKGRVEFSKDKQKDIIGGFYKKDNERIIKYFPEIMLDSYLEEYY